MTRLLRMLRLTPLLACLAGCGAAQGVINIAEIYSRSAAIQSFDRPKVISVPGLLGSRLIDGETGAPVWGLSRGLAADVNRGENLRRLALPMGDGVGSPHRLRDTLRPNGLLTVANPLVLGLPIELEVYRGVLETMRAGGWRTEDELPRDANGDFIGNGPSLFPFAYDWRLGVAEAAKDLHAHVEAKANWVDAADPMGGPPTTFSFIAHSMGALVLRYYLMYGPMDLPEALPEGAPLPPVTWAGARRAEKALFVAPPNAGSPTAFESLLNGRSLGAFQPVFRPALVGAHFSTYQLMPRPRHGRVVWSDTGEAVDLYDPEVWERMGWGLAAPGAADALAAFMPDEADPAVRRARALNFQRWALRRAETLHRLLDRPDAVPPPELDIFMVVGGGFETAATVEVDRLTGAATVASYDEGDGTVLRASALLDERPGGEGGLRLRTPLRYSGLLLLPEEHVDLTQSEVFGDNLLFWLLDGRGAGQQLRRARRADAATPAQPEEDTALYDGDR